MSEYKKIYLDLPERVDAVWSRVPKIEGEMSDFSVTTMLMVTAMGLVIPYELLEMINKNKNPHKISPRNHPEIAKSISSYDLDRKLFDSILTVNISSSNLFLGIDCNTVKISHIKEQKYIDITKSEEWEPYDPSSTRVENFIKIIRDAVSHGNVQAAGESSGHIENLFLFSENRNTSSFKKPGKGWNAITIASVDYEKFLKNWIAAMKNISRVDSKP